MFIAYYTARYVRGSTNQDTIQLERRTKTFSLALLKTSTRPLEH
jgi:hypothetical protein